MLHEGAAREWAGREWNAFLALPLLVKTIVLVSALLITFLVLSAFSDKVAMWGNHASAYWFDRSDTIASREIQAEKDRAAAAEARDAVHAKDAAVWRAKYELSIRAMNLSHEKGAQLDDEITKQVDMLAQERANPTASGVSDDVLLDALRKRQAKPQ